jgi:hypothetical protein
MCPGRTPRVLAEGVILVSNILPRLTSPDFVQGPRHGRSQSPQKGFQDGQRAQGRAGCKRRTFAKRDRQVSEVRRRVSVAGFFFVGLSGGALKRRRSQANSPLSRAEEATFGSSMNAPIVSVRTGHCSAPKHRPDLGSAETVLPRACPD